MSRSRGRSVPLRGQCPPPGRGRYARGGAHSARRRVWHETCLLNRRWADPGPRDPKGETFERVRRGTMPPETTHLRTTAPEAVPASRTREELSAMTDSQVVQRFLDGEPRAFGELVRRYDGRLVNFVHRTVGDRERAQDLVQETFIRVYRHLERFDQSKKFSTWVYTIASNLAKNELRNRSRNPLILFQTIKKNWDADHRPLEWEDGLAGSRRSLPASAPEGDGGPGGRPAPRAPPDGLCAEGARRPLLRGNRGDHAYELGHREEPPQPGPEQLRPDRGAHDRVSVRSAAARLRWRRRATPPGWPLSPAPRRWIRAGGVSFRRNPHPRAHVSSPWSGRMRPEADESRLEVCHGYEVLGISRSLHGFPRRGPRSGGIRRLPRPHVRVRGVPKVRRGRDPGGGAPSRTPGDWTGGGLPGPPSPLDPHDAGGEAPAPASRVKRPDDAAPRRPRRLRGAVRRPCPPRGGAGRGSSPDRCRGAFPHGPGASPPPALEPAPPGAGPHPPGGPRRDPGRRRGPRGAFNPQEGSSARPPPSRSGRSRCPSSGAGRTSSSTGVPPSTCATGSPTSSAPPGFADPG